MFKKFGSQRTGPMVWTQVSWTLPWDSNTFAMETLENLETCFVLSSESVEWQVFPDRSDLKKLSFLPVFFVKQKRLGNIKWGFGWFLENLEIKTHSSFIVVSSQISHHLQKNITSNHSHPQKKTSKFRVRWLPFFGATGWRCPRFRGSWTQALCRSMCPQLADEGHRAGGWARWIQSWEVSIHRIIPHGDEECRCGTQKTTGILSR